MVDLNWQKYPVYKSSGVEWLGDIPEHWEVKKLKFYFQSGKLGIKIGPFGSSIKSDIIKSSNEIKSTERYKVYGQENVIGKSFKKGEKYINSENFNRLSAYQIYPGNLVITMMGTTGRCMVVPLEIEPGIMDSHLIRISVNESEIKPDFLALLINDSFYIYTQVKINSKGSIMEGLNSSIIKSLLIAQPPISEQQAIANFLDKKLAQIDEYIAKKQRMIELLKEQKTVIINQAVTKGINADVPMKFSGIEWLGEIPEHWEVKKLKYLVKGKLKYGANEEAKSADKSQPRYIRITDFDGDGKLRDETFRSLEIHLAKDYLLSEGDILFARSGATVGKTFQFKDYSGLACFAGYLIKAIPKESIILSDYLYLFTKSEVYDIWKTSIFIQATIQNIGADKYSCLSVSLPPISEQQEIVSFIEKKSEKIERAIATIEKEIKLIQEYRTSLISETVTGKIDVRKYPSPNQKSKTFSE